MSISKDLEAKRKWDLIQNMKEEIGEEIFKNDQQVYVCPRYENLSENAHKLLTGKAYNLVFRLVNMDATREEIDRAIRYFFVMLDAMRHRLDWRKAKKELGIVELEKKYPR